MWSHALASKAHDDGFYNDEIVLCNGSIVENGVSKDSSIESASKLKPAFVKSHGAHATANSSFLSDGVPATSLMSEEKALSLGLKTPFEGIIVCTYALHFWFIKACETLFRWHRSVWNASNRQNWGKPAKLR